MTVVEFPKSWKVGVKTKSDPNDWVFNSLRFVTKEDAEKYANDLYRRWTAVTKTTVEPTDEEPNQP